MNVWLIHIGELLPTDGPVRLFRYGLLAKELVRRGHRVVQWAATFNHFTKEQRATCDTTLQADLRYEIELLFGRGYRRHVGFRRLAFHRQIARAFARRARERATPDLIICSLPTLEVAYEAISYGASHATPVIIDVRDLWPDVYLDVLPRPFRNNGRFLLQHLFRSANFIMRSATAVTAVSDSYLEWGLSRAQRPRAESDHVFPHGYEQPQFDTSTIFKAQKSWIERGLGPTNKMRCCHFGGLGRSCHLEPFFEAMRILQNSGRGNIELVVCGRGPKLQRYERQTADLKNVHLAGWVNHAELSAIMDWSDVGLASYTPNASQSLPNKPIEYLAGGLPVISTLGSSELTDLLSRYECGVTITKPTAAELAKLLADWAAQPDVRRVMAGNAGELFQTQFEAGSVYGAMANYLETISARRHQPMLRAA